MKLWALVGFFMIAATPLAHAATNKCESTETRVVNQRVSPPPPIEERPLPPMRAQHIDPLTGEDEMALADAQTQPQRGPARLPPAPVTSDGPVSPTDQNTWGKVSRNEPCPCGSGKKFKHCHGRFA